MAELVDGPAYPRLELARRGLGEGDRSNLCGINSGRDHHRDAGGHQRRLAGASRGLDQYVGFEIGEGAPAGVEVGHTHGLLQSLSSAPFAWANKRRFTRRYESRSAGRAIESGSKNAGAGPGAISPLRCRRAPAAVKATAWSMAFSSSSLVRLSVRAGSCVRYGSAELTLRSSGRRDRTARA